MGKHLSLLRFALVGIMALGAVSSIPAADQRPPNIVFILADDKYYNFPSAPRNVRENSRKQPEIAGSQIATDPWELRAIVRD